jgi:hypothetical protein
MGVLTGAKPLEINGGGPDTQSATVLQSGPAGTPSAIVWQSDDQFNAGLFLHLFIATHGGTEDIRSKANNKLKAWIMEQQEKLRKSPPPPGPKDMRIKVLEHINFPWKPSHRDKWNKAYDELVKYYSIHNSCNVPRNVPHLGEWVNNQRRSKKIYDAGKKCGLTIDRIKKLNFLGFDWERHLVRRES